MLSSITPVLLTYNEAPNIERTLSRLDWASDIVVVDSGSTDSTLAILGKHRKVRLFIRPFDTHAKQWRYAVTQTAIVTPWILRLDADYQLSDDLVDELKKLNPDSAVNAYHIAFDYTIFSHHLRSSLYPGNTILLRQGKYVVKDAGHTEVWAVEGTIRSIRARILHDDRKSIDAWLSAQTRYMRREIGVVAARPAGWKAWLRLHPPFAPFLVFIYCLFAKGLIFDGRAGLYYALQRMTAEAILSLMILESKVKSGLEPDQSTWSSERLPK